MTCIYTGNRAESDSAQVALSCPKVYELQHTPKIRYSSNPSPRRHYQPFRMLCSVSPSFFSLLPAAPASTGTLNPRSADMFVYAPKPSAVTTNTWVAAEDLETVLEWKTIERIEAYKARSYILMSTVGHPFFPGTSCSRKKRAKVNFWRHFQDPEKEK